jgi:excisionase family DNA binding protein
VAASLFSVAEAAARLGVSPSRVRQRIEDGSLAAERIGNQWGIHPQALKDGAPKLSRPMSQRMAWALIELLAGADPVVSPAERVRLRKRVAQLRDADDPVALLRSWAGSRAERRKFSIAPPDTVGLSADDRICLSGLSAPGSGVIARNVVEGYVFARSLNGLADDYFLVQPEDHRGNVILHIVPDNSPGIPAAIEINWPLIAIDLAEHSGSREQERAAELVREMLDA